MQDGCIFEERIDDVDEPAIVVKTTAIQATGQNWKYSTDFRFPYSSCDQHLSCVTPAGDYVWGAEISTTENTDGLRPLRPAPTELYQAA